MSCSGLANVLSGVALICGPRRTDLPGGSYRDQHGPPEVADGDDQQGVWRISYRPAPSVHLAWRKAGIGALLPVAPGATFGRSCSAPAVRNTRRDRPSWWRAVH